MPVSVVKERARRSSLERRQGARNLSRAQRPRRWLLSTPSNAHHSTPPSPLRLSSRAEHRRSRCEVEGPAFLFQLQTTKNPAPRAGLYLPCPAIVKPAGRAQRISLRCIRPGLKPNRRSSCPDRRTTLQAIPILPLPLSFGKPLLLLFHNFFLRPRVKKTSVVEGFGE